MSTSIIRLHVFSGIHDKDPPCYLLQIDDFHCLLDCGWDSNFSDEYVDQVAKYTKIINAVFLSHSDIRHLGALAYLVGKCGLNCPIYATSPVQRMGHLTLYDTLLNKAADGLPMKFNLDDLDDTFDKIIPLKYQEPKMLHGKGSGISVTPYLAGHMLGGTIWKISKDDNDIVYAMDYNHKKELHLNGAMIENLPRPHLLITGIYTGLGKSYSQKSQREEQLKKIVHSTLRQDGNVLFLSDTAGRCLELTYMLENMWHNQQSGLMAYGLVFLNMFGANVIENCQSYVEWMSEKVMHSFEELRTKPFDFRYTRICHTLDDLKEVPDPKVVVATQSHLNYGLTQELFLEWCDDKRNLLILTSRSRETCVSSQLYDKINQNNEQPITVRLPERILLSEIPNTTSISTNSYKALPQKQMSIVQNQSQIDHEMDDFSSDEDEQMAPGDMEWEAAIPSVGIGKEVKDDCGATYYQQQSSIHNTVTGSSGDCEEVWGTHLPGFDITPNPQYHYLHQASISGTTNTGSTGALHPSFRATKRIAYPHQEHKISWNIYGEPIDPKDPNYLYTSGSSYAMRALNQELMRCDGLPNFGNAKSKLVLNQKSLTLLSDTIGKSIGGMGEVVGDGLTQASTNSLIAEEGYTLVPARDITLNCSIMFQDFEGLSDLSAMKQTLQRLKPHEVILVSRTPESESAIVQLCRGNNVSVGSGNQNVSFQLPDKMIHRPSAGQIVNCTKEGQIFQARMSDALVSGLKFHRIGQYDLSWVEATMRIPSKAGGVGSGSTINSRSLMLRSGNDPEVDEIEEEDRMPSLDPPEQNIPEHDTIYINEPKLSDLKQTLLREGYNAEFMGGVLMIDNLVAVKRAEAGKLLLEGAVSTTYSKVRQILSRQFAIL